MPQSKKCVMRLLRCSSSHNLVYFRWCFQHAHHFSKSFSSRILASIRSSSCRRKLHLPISSSSSSLFIAAKSTYPKPSCRWAKITHLLQHERNSSSHRALDLENDGDRGESRLKIICENAAEAIIHVWMKREVKLRFFHFHTLLSFFEIAKT